MRHGHAIPARPCASLRVAVVAVGAAAVLPDGAVELLVDALVVGVGGRLRRLQRTGVVLEQVLEAFDDVVHLLFAGEVVAAAVVRGTVGP